MLLCVVSRSVEFEPLDFVALGATAGMPIRIWRIGTESGAPRRIRCDVVGDTAVAEIPSSELRSALNSLDQVPDAILLWPRDLAATFRALPWAATNHVPVLCASERTLNSPSPPGFWGTVTVLSRACISPLFDGDLTHGLSGRQYLLSIGVPHERMACALHPVHTKKWRTDCLASHEESRRLREKWGCTFVVLSIAPLEEDQNPLITLSAVARLKPEFGSIGVVHIGRGKLEHNYQTYANRLGIADRLHIIPQVDSRQFAAYYGASDVIVHCPKSDASGIRVLEAMACSRAVVASSTVGPASELIIHGTSGAIAYQGDIESLVHGLRLILQNDPKKVGEAANQVVRTRDVEPAGREVADLLAGLKLHRPKVVPLSQVARSELFKPVW